MMDEPLITVRRTVVVDSVLDRVAPYLCDFATSERWDPHTVSCRRQDDGVLGVGSTFENVQKLGPLRARFTYHVEKYEPERFVSLHAETRSLDVTDTMEFQQREGQRGLAQTVVTYTARFRLKGVARLGTPLFRRLVNRIADDGANGMRTTLNRELA